MKRTAFISTLASLLLCFWYMAAIVGLDIHIDHHDGEVYIVSLLARTDCESLHPEDECHCLEHHHGHCHSDDEDCENDVSLLSLTGDGFDLVFDFIPVLTPLMTVVTPAVLDWGSVCSYSFHISEDPPREHLRSLCVLRV